MTTVIVSDKLVEHLTKKGQRFIVVDLASCKTCGGAVSEVFARVGKDKEVATLGEAVRRFPCLDERGESLLIEGSAVELVVANRFVRVGETIRLGLRRFLGAIDVTIEGVEF